MGSFGKGKDSENGAAGYDESSGESLEAVCPSHTTERKLVSKIDLRVIPALCVLYFLAFSDRQHGNANIFGMSEPDQLDLTGTKYNTALVIFFVPYVLFEIPGNMIMKKIKPNVWLSGCMFFFGLVTICQGLVRSYGGLLTTRFFLGLCEAGTFPGCFYIIGMWYRRHEAQRRFSFFFGSTVLAGAFGGLLAAAIGKMDGLHGYRGWRWIFIIEGLMTSIIAVVWYFVIPVFPEDATWLKPEEKEFVKARLAVDQGKSAIERSITPRDVLKVVTDPKVLLGGLMYFGMIVSAYGYAYFAPSIILSYGYSAIQTQLHSVPPWVAAFCLIMTTAWLSDKAKHRYVFIVFCILINICGFATLLNVENMHVKYGALFLVAMGAFSAMPMIICWLNMNLGGHHRRAIGAAWQIGFGNIGGIIAVYSFLKTDAPRYLHGFGTGIGFSCLAIISATTYYVLCRADNQKRANLTATATLTEADKEEMGDLNPDYRYLL